MDECKGGQREWGGVGGDRSVSVKDETPKQVSQRQSDRQNTLRPAAGLRSTFIGHHTEENKDTNTRPRG